MTDPLLKISLKHCQSQTGRAKKLKFWENVHPTTCVMCHMSYVTCHVSRITCHVSNVFSFSFSFFFSFFLFFYLKKIGQCGGASRWRVCCQRGLPRLVLCICTIWFIIKCTVDTCVSSRHGEKSVTLLKKRTELKTIFFNSLTLIFEKKNC